MSWDAALSVGYLISCRGGSVVNVGTAGVCGLPITGIRPDLIRRTSSFRAFLRLVCWDRVSVLAWIPVRYTTPMERYAR